MYRDFNKNCSYEKAPARHDHLFKEADLACYKEFVQLLKNWKPELINIIRRPYDYRRQSNALTENFNQCKFWFRGTRVSLSLEHLLQNNGTLDSDQ